MTHAEAIANTIPMKPPQSPSGLEVNRDLEQVTIGRRWLRSKHYFFLVAILSASLWVGGQWSSQSEAPLWLYFATFFCLSWTLNVATMFANRTVLNADADRVSVKHGPLPSPFGQGGELRREEVDKIFVAPHGFMLAVRALLKTGEERIVAAPFATPAQAHFVEREVQRLFGLKQTPVHEGAEDDAPQFNFLGLLIPLFVGGVLLTFSQLATADVKGAFSGKTGRGAALSFIASDCESGQRKGFDGVTLTASGSSTEVRVVNDPVKGQLLVVAAPGEPNQVLDAAL